MASGLDTESIISQLMAIEQNKVTAVQRRQVAVAPAQDRPKDDQGQARRGQDGRRRPRRRRAVEGRADHDVLGPDEGRRRPCSAAPASAATRSRSTGSPPRRSTASRYTPTPARGKLTFAYSDDAGSTRHDQRQGERDRDRHRRRRSTRNDARPSTPPSSRTAASSSSSSPRARPATSGDFTSTRRLAAGGSMAEDAAYARPGRTSTPDPGRRRAPALTPSPTSSRTPSRACA